jgi:pimeloyl-ACP methyl ester carboxylesterase
MKPDPDLAINHGFADVGDVRLHYELRIPDSGHWVQNEAVEQVNEALLRFLGN